MPITPKRATPLFLTSISHKKKDNPLRNVIIKDKFGSKERGQADLPR